MLQYGYANFSESGYQLVSEAPFLQDSDRVKQLGSLTHYVMNTSPAYRAQGQMTYTGLLTDLGYRGETPRYYFQASGPSFVRGGSCAHGYVQADEPEFFGAPFLRLLRARFQAPRAIQALPAAGCAAHFPDIGFPPVDDAITPAPMDEALLAAVVEQLLQSGRVLLRLDRQGDEAPAYARRVLLRIYSCLPYAARKFCGFITGVPMSRVVCPESGDELPASVKLILVDGDAQLPDRLPGIALFDMNAPAPAAKRRPNAAAFLDFLLGGEADRRERYFSMVSQALESVDNQRSLPMQTYLDAFQMQELADRPFCMASLHQWANWLQRNQGVVAAGMRAQFLRLLAEKITAETAAACLTGPEGAGVLPPLESFSQLWQPARAAAEEETASASAILALLEAVLPPEAAADLGRKLSDWYYEAAAEQVRPLLLQAGDGTGRLLPTPGAIDALDRLRRQAEPAARAGVKNRVAQTAARTLSQRLEQSCAQMCTQYSQALEAERARAAALAEGLSPVSCAGLVRLYDQMLQADAFPLCMERMGAGVGFAQAFGSAAANGLAARMESLPRPASRQALLAFEADLSALTGSALYQSGLLRAQIERLTPLLRAIQLYHEAKDDLSVPGQLTLLHESYGETFAAMHPALLEDLRRPVRAYLMQQPPCTLAELPALLKQLAELAPAEPQLVQRLSATLWQVSTAAPEMLAPLVGSVGQWEVLRAALGCQVTVRFADGGRQAMTVQEMWSWMQWVQGKSPETVPAPVLRCAGEQPARAVQETHTVRQYKQLLTALTLPQQLAFCRCLLAAPAPAEYDFAKKVVKLLRQSGARGADLLCGAGRGWPDVIALVYGDPMSGPQGEILRQLKTELSGLDSALEARMQRLHTARETRKNRLRRVMAAMVAAADLVPMVLLWVCGGASPAMTLTVLAALLVQAAAACGVLLLVHGLAPKKAARDLKWYGLGAAPGLLLTLAGTVLAILL